VPGGFTYGAGSRAVAEGLNDRCDAVPGASRKEEGAGWRRHDSGIAERAAGLKDLGDAVLGGLPGSGGRAE
jgi:hypothetical protein